MDLKAPFVITISREIGSGGHTVGRILAEKLHTRYCDKNLIEALKKQEKASEITEDDLKDLTKEVQDITDSFVKKVDEVYKAKEKEVLED